MYTYIFKPLSTTRSHRGLSWSFYFVQKQICFFFIIQFNLNNDVWQLFQIFLASFLVTAMSSIAISYVRTRFPAISIKIEYYVEYVEKLKVIM